MRWLSRLFRRRSLDREIDAELRFHLDEHVRELIAAGRSPREARREARRALGGFDQTRERLRDVRGTRWLEEAGQDARFALRGLRREIGFAATAVLTLGIGIGAATAIFSAVNPVLFEPLAYPHPERIVSIADRSDEGSPVPVTFGTYLELRRRGRTVAALAAFKPWRPTLVGEQEPERLEGQRVGADYFRVLGVTPALGRGFDPDDDRVGGPDVVVLADGLWRRRFAGDPGIVGQPIELDGVPYTVVGVMPASFENVPAPGAQAWSLLQYDASLPNVNGREWGHHLGLVGRLRPDTALQAGRREIDEIAASPVAELVRPPWAALENGLTVRPLAESATAASRPVLLALLGAVGLLVCIACVNVTSLLLARGARRRGELSMRAALGAGRGRLVRQLLTESLVLAALGGILGVGLARIGVSVLMALSPPDLPRVDAIGVDATALAFTLGATLLIGLAVGLAPALGVSRDDSYHSAREAAQRGGVGGNLWARRTLVVAEVALALVLLAGAGLLFRSVQGLFAVAPGFDADGVLAMQVQTAGRHFEDDDAVHRFFDQALAQVLRAPGVESAAWTSQLPLSGDQDVYGIHLEREMPSGTDGAAYRYAVRGEYFTTMGIPLLGGRLLGDDDAAGAPGAVLVNESFARQAFPGQDPIGQRLHLGRTDMPWYTVVGVVGDVKQASLEVQQATAVYVDARQWYFADPVRWLVVRAHGDAAGLVPALRAAVWSIDSDQPIVRVDSLHDLVLRSEAQRRFALRVLEAFAAMALVLAGVGLYGVLAGSVAERTREIGVRAALGASRRRIVALVLRQGMTLTGIGVVVGMAGAAAATRALVSLLFGVSRLDPLTHVAVVLLLGLVALAACWIPASRAAGVDPVRALRTD